MCLCLNQNWRELSPAAMVRELWFYLKYMAQIGRGRRMGGGERAQTCFKRCVLIICGFVLLLRIRSCIVCLLCLTQKWREFSSADMIRELRMYLKCIAQTGIGRVKGGGERAETLLKQCVLNICVFVLFVRVRSCE